MNLDNLIEALMSTDTPLSEDELVELWGHPPEEVVCRLANRVLAASSPEERERCFSLFEHMGASASMEAHRADGWYDQVKCHVSQFDIINKVLGERFLAYAFILGVQIRALMVDTRALVNTAVHFTLDDEQAQTLSLGEFKLRTVQALLYDQKNPQAPALPLHPDTAVEVLGSKNMLLAPLFDISIERLLLATMDPEAPRYLVVFRTEGALTVAELDDFFKRIHARLKQELVGMAEKPFTIDLSAVEKARQVAESGHQEEVIRHLSSWPGLLSVLHRTPMAKQLSAAQLNLVGEGVVLLGEALESVSPGLWSEELYKLGLMIVREGVFAGRLLWHLGRVMNAKGEFGIAIGLLKRALALGQSEGDVLPLLGRAFLRRGKVVAAAALLEVASAKNMAHPELEVDLREVRERLGAAEVEWRVPAPVAAQEAAVP